MLVNIAQKGVVEGGTDCVYMYWYIISEAAEGRLGGDGGPGRIGRCVPFAGGAKTGPPVVVMADVTWFDWRVCDWRSAWQWLVGARGRVW